MLRNAGEATNNSYDFLHMETPELCADTMYRLYDLQTDMVDSD